jgi:hypothetical protein
LSTQCRQKRFSSGTCSAEQIFAGELQLDPGSIDVAMRVWPGDSVEVRSWDKDGSAAFAVGQAVAIGHQLRLPLLSR